MKFLASLVLTILVIGAKGWDYKSASTWGTEFPQCKEANQSPISLGRDTSIITFYGYFDYTRPQNTGESELEVVLKIRNTGKHIRIDNFPEFAFWGAGLSPTIPYGGFFKYYNNDNIVKYKIDHMHIHWGSAKGQGSEHRLNGEQMEGEIHIVTYNTQYSSLAEARTKDNGVHIIAYLLQEEKEEGVQEQYAWSNDFSRLIEAVRMVPFKGDYAYYRVPSVREAFQYFGLLNSYIRYKGSFTTPPCDKNVLWTVVYEPLSIATSEMKAFRDLYAEGRDVLENHRIGDNFRPLQDVNNRKVYYSDLALKWYDENGVTIPHPGI